MRRNLRCPQKFIDGWSRQRKSKTPLRIAFMMPDAEIEKEEMREKLELAQFQSGIMEGVEKLKAEDPTLYAEIMSLPPLG
jgi:hypothetical protein